MSSNHKKSILFIVEGEKGEVNVLKKLTTILYANNEYKIYPINGSIYELFDDLKSDEDLDILLHLKSKAKTDEDREILSKRYNSIYLIFDFDPHHHKYKLEKLKDMLLFFDDALDNGKLLINYPMLESYRHLKEFPDYEFKDRMIDFSDLNKYKEIVGKESVYSNLNKYDYNLVMCMLIHHLSKANYILTKQFKTGSLDDFNSLDQSKYNEILEIQNKLKNDLGKFYVLNTSIFFLIELKPKSFFRQIKRFICY